MFYSLVCYHCLFLLIFVWMLIYTYIYTNYHVFFVSAAACDFMNTYLLRRQSPRSIGGRSEERPPREPPTVVVIIDFLVILIAVIVADIGFRSNGSSIRNSNSSNSRYIYRYIYIYIYIFISFFVLVLLLFCCIVAAAACDFVKTRGVRRGHSPGRIGGWSEERPPFEPPIVVVITEALVI